jgi:hypothetical protein
LSSTEPLGFAVFLNEGMRLVREAEKEAITLRLMGALAVRNHSHEFGNLFGETRKPTDIDFVTYGAQRHVVKDFMTRMNYEPDNRIISLFGGTRHIYYDRSGRWHVDLFMDKLEFCHTIELTDRLKLDTPTIPLADIVLEKMQIVQINEKDLKDTAVLFREHEVARSDREQINGEYIAGILSRDWGFYYTVVQNLEKSKGFVSAQDLPGEDKSIIRSRIDKLLSMIEDEPKNGKWKMRARIGPRMKWYRDVEEVTR